jgi:hypothetical protein
MSVNTQESRVNVFLRLVGLIVLGFGAALMYLTYSEAAQANLVPQITPVFYLGSGLLMIVGALALIAKYE